MLSVAELTFRIVVIILLIISATSRRDLKLSTTMLQTRVILRINASNIKIIDSFTETVRQDYAIDCVSFAAQDSNHQLVFRNRGAEEPFFLNYTFVEMPIKSKRASPVSVSTLASMKFGDMGSTTGRMSKKL